LLGYLSARCPAASSPLVETKLSSRPQVIPVFRNPLPSTGHRVAAVDRRRFLGGTWSRDSSGAAGARPGAAEPSRAVASAAAEDDSPAAACLLVRAHPARIEAVAAAIPDIDGVDRVTAAPGGRLIATVRCDHVAAALGAITALPGVLAVSIRDTSLDTQTDPENRA
jgi:nitrate reductase NapAB chaperone NapD